ncbi:hypothetical protein [Nonomuraea sp. JJY05]|uniref:hypothetical protein n=1 Tax=Nonomuraea sp. JJY05 TaxID=3350255 RepID=UPI00373E768B
MEEALALGRHSTGPHARATRDRVGHAPCDDVALAENAQARSAGLPERQRARMSEMHEYHTSMVRHLETLLGEYTALRAR